MNPAIKYPQACDLNPLENFSALVHQPAKGDKNPVPDQHPIGRKQRGIDIKKKNSTWKVQGQKAYGGPQRNAPPAINRAFEEVEQAVARAFGHKAD